MYSLFQLYACTLQNVTKYTKLFFNVPAIVCTTSFLRYAFIMQYLLKVCKNFHTIKLFYYLLFLLSQHTCRAPIFNAKGITHKNFSRAFCTYLLIFLCIN